MINTVHLLLCILRNENDPTTKLLTQQNINYDIVKEQFKLMLANDADSYEDLPTSSSFSDEKENENEGKENPFIPTSESKGSKKTKTPVLDNFGRDVTSLAEQDKLDPVVGREKEIERVSQILSRRKKNNPLLIGEPGVGKSAIAEGLVSAAAKLTRVLILGLFSAARKLAPPPIEWPKIPVFGNTEL